jgi:hypothetical protein
VIFLTIFLVLLVCKPGSKYNTHITSKITLSLLHLFLNNYFPVLTYGAETRVQAKKRVNTLHAVEVSSYGRLKNKKKNIQKQDKMEMLLKMKRKEVTTGRP